MLLNSVKGFSGFFGSDPVKSAGTCTSEKHRTRTRSGPDYTQVLTLCVGSIKGIPFELLHTFFNERVNIINRLERRGFVLHLKAQ